MSSGRRKQGFHPDDAALWQKVTETVTPNPKRGDHIDADNMVDWFAVPDSEPGDHQAPVLKVQAPVQAQALPPKPQKLPDLTPDKQPGLDRRTSTRLRRGQMPIEGRLDMHGMFQDEAHRALRNFINHAQSHDKKCVLVITGKGLNRDGSVGVLRSMTPRWLNEPGLRDKVVAFRQAARQHGGEGALYVLLKRRR